MAINAGKIRPNLSPSAIDRLGERLRRDALEPGDLDVLDAYEAAYDNLLLSVSNTVDRLLTEQKIPFLLAGRLKRPKSTIRKLKRDGNENMGLSKMGDILGVRVIVKSIAEQEFVLKTITQGFDVHDIHDYRDSGQIYRSLHVLIKNERLIEIQIRTIPQHVWAVESESFGEKVKEGTLVGDEKEYLTALSIACTRLDQGTIMSEQDYPSTPLMKNRTPLSGLHNGLTEMFDKVSWETSRTGTSFVIVYDNETKQLLRGEESFSPDQRHAAVQMFQRNTRQVSDTRYESLVLNAPSIQVLKVTHPRFFL